MRTKNTIQDQFLMVETSKLKVVDQPMEEITDYILEGLRGSIKKYGIKEPIRINENYEIIAGRHRHMIANELGMSHVPCIMSDTTAFPEEKALKFDLEIYRRQLTHKTFQLYNSKRNEYVKELQDQTFKSLMEKTIPELHESVTEIFYNSDNNLENNSDFLAKFCSLSHEGQKSFVKEVVLDNASAEEKLRETNSKFREQLQLTEQLQEKVQKLSNAEEQLKEQLNKVKLLESDLTERINEKIKRKEAEFAEKYKAELPSDVAKLLEEESDKIKKEAEESYREELEDLQEKLIQVTSSFKGVRIDHETTQQKLEDMIREKKDTELYTTKVSNDLKAKDYLLQSLVKPEKFGRRFELIYEELNNIFVNLLEIGAEETIEKNYKENYAISLRNTKDVIEEIEKLVKV